MFVGDKKIQNLGLKTTRNTVVGTVEHCCIIMSTKLGWHCFSDLGGSEKNRPFEKKNYTLIQRSRKLENAANFFNLHSGILFRRQ